VTDLAGATHAVEQYEEATDAIAERGLDATISIKLSQLGQTVDRSACVANLNEILDHAQSVGVRVEVDMEESGLVSDTLSLFREAVAKHPETRLAIQAALRRTPLDLEAMASVKPRIRLVKGAYAEPLELAQQGKAGDQGAVQVPHRLAVSLWHRPGVRQPRQRVDRVCEGKRR
jgi:proline dehydrogenase